MVFVTSNYSLVIPTVAYDLTTPIRSIIFSFNNFVSELDADQFLGDSTIMPCDCDKSPFDDKDHGHILTRILRLIKNNILRKTI